MELSTTSILSLLDTDKATRTSFINAHIEAMKEGNANPVVSHIQAKNYEQMLKEMFSNEEYKELVLTEAQKHGKSFEMHNAKVEVKEAGTKYDYSVCQDEKWNEMQRTLITLQADIKAREKFLQNIPESGMADPETGSMIYRAAKSSTTTVAVTLK